MKIESAALLRIWAGGPGSGRHAGSEDLARLVQLHDALKDHPARQIGSSALADADYARKLDELHSALKDHVQHLSGKIKKTWRCLSKPSFCECSAACRKASSAAGAHRIFASGSSLAFFTPLAFGSAARSSGLFGCASPACTSDPAARSRPSSTSFRNWSRSAPSVSSPTASIWPARASTAAPSR